MSKNILQNKGIELNTIGQIQTTKYGGICIFDLNGKLLSNLIPENNMCVNTLKSLLIHEIRQSEIDQRKFINTANGDLIRLSIIGFLEFVEDKGIAIYDQQDHPIYWFEEPSNNAIKGIIEQIRNFSCSAEGDWSSRLFSKNNEDFIKPINWNIRLF